MSTSSSDNEHGQEDLAPLAARRIWFPYVWTGLLVGVAVFMQLGEADQDAKNVSVVITTALLLIGLSIWFIRSSPFSRRTRWRVGLAPWIGLIVFGSMVELINNGDVGIVGWRWRWSAVPDEQLQMPVGASTAEGWESTASDYPRYLGSGYRAEVPGVQLQTDWKKHPPQELWRQKIGAGWSAFSIVGHFAVTQEQRGPNELVTCYDLRTGELIWSHADEVRFDPGGSGAWGGVGPRATPTIHKQRILAQGATGILNCLDARTGKKLWSHDTLAENGAENIMWGKACSPLVVPGEAGRDMVVVSVGGPNGRSLVSYDFETGEEIWAGGDRRSSYASPIDAELLGQRQLISVNENFVTAHRPDTGAVLWEHPWPGNSDTNATIPQPVPLSSARVFLSKGYGIGSSLLQLARDHEGAIQITPVWQPAIKTVMKTKMCNVVMRNGFVYGLDNGIMQCIDLETGKSQWKKRRRPAIGHGQIMLIGDVILALTESGELLLIEPSPKKYHELASVRVLSEEQVTWNNPAFASPYLLVRNGEEAACYELPIADQPPLADEAL